MVLMTMSTIPRPRARLLAAGPMQEVDDPAPYLWNTYTDRDRSAMKILQCKAKTKTKTTRTYAAGILTCRIMDGLALAGRQGAGEVSGAPIMTCRAENGCKAAGQVPKVAGSAVRGAASAIDLGL